MDAPRPARLPRFPGLTLHGAFCLRVPRGFESHPLRSSWKVYLAGEIHSDWRERIADGAKEAGLDITFTSPVTDHAASDDVGVAILG